MSASARRRKAAAARRGKPAGAARGKPAAASRDKPAAKESPVAVRDTPSAPRRWWVRLILTAAPYAGFVIALYLTYVHYRGYITRCYVVHGCEEVQASQYSTILGVPLALMGTVFFAVMFYLGIALLTRSGATLVLVYKVLAYAGALTVIPLFLIQAVILKAFCTYCLATEVIMLSMWVVTFLLPSSGRRGEAAEAVAAAR